MHLTATDELVYSACLLVLTNSCEELKNGYQFIGLRALNLYNRRDYCQHDQQEVSSTPVEIARDLPEHVLGLAGYFRSPSAFHLYMSK